MTNRLFAATLLFASSIAACGAPDEAPSGAASALSTRADTGFDWPVPEHWAPETIPFPLPFAPELPYAGVEELRFMPHFFDPTADSYFSYSFAWLLDGAGSIGADQLSRDLATYYSGLSKSADPAHFDASAHHAELSVATDGHIRGVVQTTDGFNASAPLRLEAEIAVTWCGDRRVILFTLSPHPFGDDMWTTLLVQRQTFRCT
jgi:hypothetical protein